MQAEPDTRRTPEDILRLPVKNARGEMIPLAELARASWVTGAPKLDRFNGLPSMKISGGAAPGRSTGEAMKAMEDVAAKLPPGIGFEWSGTSYEERQSGSQAPFLFAVSLVVVFLCLAALYESWSIPFAVMLVVPLGIFGSVLAVDAARPDQRRVLQGRPDRHHRPVGEERHPDHRVRPRPCRSRAWTWSRRRWKPAACASGPSS
jgi:multidrug efflux pump